MKVRAKKQLGQHFLTNLDAADRIAASINEYLHTPVLEVGPGMGVLSEALLRRGHNLQVIEIDTESVEYLQQHFAYFQGGAHITTGDILHHPAEQLIPDHPSSPFVLIGNYPYNISSQIFFRVLELRNRIPCVAGMLQKEVAERLCADPGGRDYGILTVLLRAWYDAEYLFTVDKNDFYPAPKVHGGVLKLVRNRREALPVDETLFKQVVKAAFSQRRKTLRNSLRQMFGEAFDFTQSTLFTRRAETLDVEDYFTLCRMYIAAQEQ